MNPLKIQMTALIWFCACAAGAAETETIKTTTDLRPSLADPKYPLSVPATTRTEAVTRARIGAGRLDPFTPTAGMSKNLPLNGNSEINPDHASKKVHLPPPPKFSENGLLPPPPPGVVSLPNTAAQAANEAGRGVIETDLPEPPEKPLIADKMKLVGLVGEKAFFTFTDAELRRANKYPSTVILATGEQFESVHLVSIEKSTVVLEEDGERITKELERIR